MKTSLTNEELRSLSKRLEDTYGDDSIPTIETHYLRGEHDEPGAPFLCAYSRPLTMGQHDCRYRRRDPVVMWLHVHFTGHGLSFVGGTTPERVLAMLDAGTLERTPVGAR